MATLLLVYSLCYNPFVSASYVYAPLRISLEGIVLFLSLIFNIYYFNKNIFLWLAAITVLFSCFPLFDTDTAVHVVSSYNKMIFFILVVGLFYISDTMLLISLKIWINLWRLLCCLAILAFIGYITGLIPFSLFELDVDAGAPYTYMHNAILGNIVPRFFYSIEYGRVAGFMYEPGLVGFFYGFNILVAKRWICDEKKARNFILLNFAAGLTSGSTSLIFFIVLFVFSSLIFGGNKHFIAIKVLLLAPFFVAIIFYILSSGLMEFTSSLERIARFQLGMEILNNNTFITLLFGNGIGVSVKEGVGISSGPLNIFVERGAVMLSFIVFMFFKFSRYNKWLLFYLFYYSVMFEMFWFPLFLIGIAISYAQNNRHCYSENVCHQLSTCRTSC